MPQNGPKPDDIMTILIAAMGAVRRLPERVNLPYGTGDASLQAELTVATNALARATVEERVTWTHLLQLEVAQALATRDPTKIRAGLEGLIATAVQWIIALDSTASE